jgi:hypothetical protein
VEAIFVAEAMLVVSWDLGEGEAVKQGANEVVTEFAEYIEGDIADLNSTLLFFK